MSGAAEQDLQAAEAAGGAESAARDPSLSYRYWVGSRGSEGSAAPAAQPRKITREEAASMHRSGSQGSLWNQGGTWEERSLNDWAKGRMSELMAFSHCLHFGGSAYDLALELESLSGDTTIVVVRNKKKHGYILDITLKLSGCCRGDAEQKVAGSLSIHEATYGDTDSIHVEASLDSSKSALPEDTRTEMEAALGQELLPTLQRQLEAFEQELRLR